MNDYCGYVRVSTKKQGEGVSLEAQKEAIESYAAQNGLNISEWFEEQETAAKRGRPVFNKMVKALRQQRMRGLVVHKIDRSARNFRDWARVGDLADEGFDIRFATETLDFQTRGGRLSADIQAVIAADYIRNLREEIRKGIDGRLAQGLYPFGAPIGYLDNGRGKIKTPDPERASLVKEMFALYATGRHSLRTLRVEMTRRGLTNRNGKAPSKRLIETALSNPFYCGIIRISTTGATYQGIHEGLIDVATYDRVQDVKNGKCGKKVTRHDHIFRGLFRCGNCRFAMIPEQQKGRVYYRCHSTDCPTTSVREDWIEGAFLDSLRSLTLTEDARETLVDAVSAWVNDRIKEARQYDIGETTFAELDERLDRLTDAMIDRLIDKEAYSQRREKLLLQKAELERAQSKNQDLRSAPMNVRNFLELAKNLTGLYQTLTKAERRRFVDSATSNRLVFGKNLQFEPSDWLQTIPDGLEFATCEHTRPKTRTRHESGDKIIVRLVEAAKSENVALLSDMILQASPEIITNHHNDHSEPNDREGQKFERGKRCLNTLVRELRPCRSSSTEQAKKDPPLLTGQALRTRTSERRPVRQCHRQSEPWPPSPGLETAVFPHGD
jgi:site-specific DNA recombinase